MEKNLKIVGVLSFRSEIVWKIVKPNKNTKGKLLVELTWQSASAMDNNFPPVRLAERCFNKFHSQLYQFPVISNKKMRSRLKSKLFLTVSWKCEPHIHAHYCSYDNQIVSLRCRTGGNYLNWRNYVGLSLKHRSHHTLWLQWMYSSAIEYILP